jgi:predicted DNA-binding transcriptional regulator AlpA
MPKSRRIKCRKQIAGEFNVSVPTTYRMQKRGELPPPVRVSVGRVGWWEDELEEFKNSLRKVGEPPPKEEDDDRGGNPPGRK